MFSPITHRSLSVRLLFATIYFFLTVFGITMLVPFLIMITGALEPSLKETNSLFPWYVANKQALWARYLEVRAGDLSGFKEKIPPLPEAGDQEIARWREFLAERKPAPFFFKLDFIRTTRMPSYTGRQFRIWLLNQHDNDIDRLNEALGTQYRSVTTVIPPYISLEGNSLAFTPLIKSFYEFVATQPESMISAYSAGDFFRSRFLPKRYGGMVNIENYNKKNGTSFSSFKEIPFSSVVPSTGVDDWFVYVSQLLRPDFVELTASGIKAMEERGSPKVEFIRKFAKPQDLKVATLDVQFAEWAASKGISDARIPQDKLNRVAFEEAQGFWKWQFLILNFQRVTDEMVLHGRAFWNTIVLVVFFVAGALTVNPLAAYALSRFKLKHTYTILLFCIATIAFPAEVTMIPVFVQLKNFNLLNTYWALIIPTVANGLSIFLLKGFFDSLPKELFEAAEIDGAGELRMFWLIAMNLSKPILAVKALAAFTTAYGAFLYALILVTDSDMWTIMVYVYQLQMVSDTPVLYAALVLTGILTMVVFIGCQRVIMRGIVVPSDK